MDATPVQRRALIVMLFLGVVAGAVAGWFAHQGVVVRSSELSVSEVSPANSLIEIRVGSRSALTASIRFAKSR